jgi:SPP1 gp7 family putative phage head morphogenesis protein
MPSKRKRPKALPPTAIPPHRAWSNTLKGVAAGVEDLVRKALGLRSDAWQDDLEAAAEALEKLDHLLGSLYDPAQAETAAYRTAQANIRAANAQVKGLDVGAPFSLTPTVRAAVRRRVPDYLASLQDVASSSLTRAKKAVRKGDPLGPVWRANKRYADFRARNNVARANAEITEQRNRDLGIQRYKWVSSRDERVRRRHRELDGTIQRWDLPPESDTNGRRAHPGVPWNCRCTATVLEEDILAALEGP